MELLNRQGFDTEVLEGLFGRRGDVAGRGALTPGMLARLEGHRWEKNWYEG